MKNVFIFLGGAVVGGLATWKLVEKKYRDLADEEIESVVERFSKPCQLSPDKPKVEEITGLQEEVEKLNYSTINENKEEVNPKTEKKKKSTIKVEVIKMEDFGTKDDFDTATLILWNDGYVTTDQNEVISQPSELIGNSLSYFDNNDELDCVYVRNKSTKIDYEILKSEKDFE
jgi:hypothetical protein